MIRIVVIVVVIVILIFIGASIISQFVYVPYVSSNDTPGMLIDKIVGNANDPQASLQFQGANVSTNLWNLQSGQGNTMISIYTNSSMHIFSNYTNVITKSANIVGYPSARFRYGLPIMVSNAIKDNISSTVSFNLVNTSQEMYFDISYDIMIQPSQTTFSPVVEIMIYLDYGPYYVNHLELGNFITNTTIHSVQKSITWNMEESKSATNGAPLITFIPDSSVFFPLNLSSFISETQTILDMNLSSDYIQQINIGMEFGFSSFSHYEFSLWLSATCTIDGTEVNILGRI
jgi:hypothetical protein